MKETNVCGTTSLAGVVTVVVVGGGGGGEGGYVKGGHQT
jgi:hypothetical protein